MGNYLPNPVTHRFRINGALCDVYANAIYTVVHKNVLSYSEWNFTNYQSAFNSHILEGNLIVLYNDKTFCQ